ncbi:hypothetical protein HYALB_00013754 [Hymenoscyphus albidus]|uniref:Uncharacterized protein n=1 Tax=Hymenoscyphus albidus TaxID=595503 RepID=A0A9N9Q6N1_9HELO|nr:hypothetical protein HYALB_00013754 [Hymenoscyphus albidus]
MGTPYADYVRAQSCRNPCLYNLCQFLDRENKENECQITSLDFFSGNEMPRVVDLQIIDVASLLRHPDCNMNTAGRILIIENLTRDVVELLGVSLNVDPPFFASHIYGPTVEITASKPSSAILPSKSKNLNFLSIQYQHTIQFHDAVPPRKLFRDSNSKPFQGGYEDFLERQAFPDQVNWDPQRSSLRKDLVYYFQKKRPPGFKSKDPTLLSLAYYPLKITAADWVIYIEARSNIIKQYEYSTEATPGPTSAGQKRLTTIDSDLRALQVWGRRSLKTLSKLRSGLRFLKYRTKDVQEDEYLTLIDDYEHLISMVNIYRHRLETLVPLLTSVVQITDTRRSLREAANVTRLTNLALFFVPLSFVSSLFSINEGVSAKGYGYYFALAIPVFGIVLFLAHPPESVKWLGYVGRRGRSE